MKRSHCKEWSFSNHFHIGGNIQLFRTLDERVCEKRVGTSSSFKRHFSTFTRWKSLQVGSSAFYDRKTKGKKREKGFVSQEESAAAAKRKHASSLSLLIFIRAEEFPLSSSHYGKPLAPLSVSNFHILLGGGGNSSQPPRWNRLCDS